MAIHKAVSTAPTGCRKGILFNHAKKAVFSKDESMKLIVVLSVVVLTAAYVSSGPTHSSNTLYYQPVDGGPIMK